MINNLPGTPAFCPMVRRTDALDAWRAMALDARARETAMRVRPDLVARAAAFLLLNDSRSSFAIEGERPSGDRASRWGQAIARAGTFPLSLDELNRLQRIVIGDARFVRLGLRDEGGFVGVHDRDTSMPVPDHISARAEDLPSLLQGVIDYAQRSIGGGIDPVVAAACLALVSSIFTPISTAMDAFTAGSSIMRSRSRASIRPDSSFPSASRSTGVSTSIAACSNPIRHRSCH
ncbi:MAG: filamentation induced by cAMP protein Fic [Novosphingobium sp.]|nr:filamentation induced by cAMP protein Fic [Novosphingobium sp.]